MRIVWRSWLLVSLFALSCGGGAIGSSGRLVGGACQTSSQCDFVCHDDSHYPGGYCTVRCASDAECPTGTACVEDGGGICAVLCKAQAECSGWGRGYICDNVRRRGGGGEHLVCRVD